MHQNIKYNISLDTEEFNKKKFRYVYNKEWICDNKLDSKKTIVAILLNPSKATLTRNDKTLDILTETFINEGYSSMTILNLFSIMCSNSKDIPITEKEYEDKNWKFVQQYIEENKDKDFFIGWGKSFNNIKEENYIKNAKIKKKFIENFIRKNDLKKKVYCFRSNNGRALHPSRYKENWEYGKYFLR